MFSSGMNGQSFGVGGIRSHYENQSQQIIRQAREYREKFERERPQTIVPVLTSLVQVEVLVSSPPEIPIIGVSSDIPIRQLGRAVFGSNGYNRVKRVNGQGNVGAHFDVIAGHFVPWTIHVNERSMGVIRATFLSAKAWKEYLEKTDNLSELGLRHNDPYGYHRRQLGSQEIDAAEMLFKRNLDEGSRTLIWHGGLELGQSPPALHDIYRYSRTSGETGPDHDEYTVYARQILSGDFKDYVEV